MGRKRHIAGIAVLVLATANLVLWLGVANAGTRTVHFTASESGTYECGGPCVTAVNFTAAGTMHAVPFGEMTDTTEGTVLSFNEHTNCLEQAETWVLSLANGQGSIFLRTTHDTFCFTSDPNVSIETATFVITGGSGRFSHASGSGSFHETVLTQPQVGSGTIEGTVSY